MERDALARLLDREGEVFAACRRAVLGGAEYRVWESTLPASHLVTIYARGERNTQKRTIATLGFPEAVAALRAEGERPVRIAAVDVGDPPFHFQLFLDEAGTAVIACLGIDQSWKT